MTLALPHNPSNGPYRSNMETLDPLKRPVTFEALCATHAELLEAQAVQHLEAEAAKQFIEDAAAAGVQIESVSDRDAIRSMLNYWTATLNRLPSSSGAAVASDHLDEQSSASQVLARFDASRSPEIDEKSNPFVGLAAFDVGQSDVFFGREKVVADLLQLVCEQSLVVVSGASGSGKSSLVRAGLAGAVRADQRFGNWVIAIATPGRDPIASIIAALAAPGPELGQWVDQARTRVGNNPDDASALAAVRKGEGELLLIIDQLEELFSLATPADRELAAKALSAIAHTPGCHVVVTIRDEYLEGERAQRVLPALDLANAVEFRVPALDSAEIKAAIVEPAARVGLIFQDGLIDRIVAEVGTDPAALPLLQYSLLSLWRNRQGNRITLQVYEKVGGPATALSNAAQGIYNRFVEQARQNTRIVFQQLVRPSLIYEFVRDRVTRGELQQLLEPESINTVIKPYADAGLIRITPGSDRSEDRIEIAHEALIRNWDLLRRWAGEVRDRERSFLEVDARAEHWEQSGRRIGYLLFASLLNSAETAHKQYKQRARVDPIANARVERFLHASRASQRRIIGGLATVVILAALTLLGLLMFSSEYRDKLLKLRGAQEIIADQDTKLAADSRSPAVDDDAAREFIQLLLSRGIITTGDLPAEFADMTPAPQSISIVNWPASFDEDFLGLRADFLPTVTVAGTIRLKFPNLRVFYDPQSGLPLLTISQSDRFARLYMGRNNRLFAIKGLSGQADLEAKARDGFALARLVDARDVAWGVNPFHAAVATSMLPTMYTVRQHTDQEDKLGEWSNFSNSLRLSHNPTAKRVIYLAGTVPSREPNEPPKWLWKVAVSVKDGALVADGFIIPGRGAPNQMPGPASLDDIAKIAAVDFSRLKSMIEQSKTTDGGQEAPKTASETRSTPASVYIQVRDVTDEQASSVRLTLAAKKLVMPPVQRVGACVQPAQLRYYYPQDSDAAAGAASIAGDAIRAAGIGDGQVAVKRLSLKRFPNAKAGNLELWLCGPPKP